MYEIVSLEAVVLRALPQKENDMTFVVYSRERGKMYINATGIKKQGAKHKMNMQPFAVVNIDVVRGQTGWRLIGSGSVETWDRKANILLQRLWGRVFRLVVDLTPIEQAEEGLYELLLEMFHEDIWTVDDKNFPYLEAKITARLLDILGWWTGEHSVDEMAKDKETVRDFIKVVNQGLETAYS